MRCNYGELLFREIWLRVCTTVINFRLYICEILSNIYVYIYILCQNIMRFTYLCGLLGVITV